MHEKQIGRSDLPGGDKLSLYKSLVTISNMSKQLNIYPGHGSSSTIGAELKNNNQLINFLK